MFSSEQYQLLDFGRGRKLERFGQVILDRPCPAADGVQNLALSKPEVALRAAARFDRHTADQGEWRIHKPLPENWRITHGSICLELRPTPFGHVGVFPEQAANWDWIAERVQKAARRLRVLNLFAYTGGGTLAAAAAGAEVTHVDAAASTVAWARRNAELSGLSAAPIRWIVEDALKFARRELKRGNRYDAVILDPPTYGHGPKGEPWKLSEHLMPLLACCGKLTSTSDDFPSASPQPAFFLLSCHAPGFGPAELSAYLADAVFSHCRAGGSAQAMSLVSADGRSLPCGATARWP